MTAVNSSNSKSNTTFANLKDNPGVETSTFGWDTVFAIPIANVNNAIKNAKSSPASFESQLEEYTTRGTFSDWQICQGGDGKLIHFAIPIPSIEFIYQSTTYPFQNGTATIEVQLHYVPHDTQPADANQGTLHNLMVKTTAETSDDPVVSILELDFPGQTVDVLMLSLMQESLSNWFNANLTAFTHVFATVNLNRVADKAQFQWLLPTYTSYAYVDRTTLEDSLLGILCMTENRSPNQLVEQLSTFAIPDGSTAGFLISKNRYLEKMLLPGLPLAFEGSSVSDYGMNSDGSGIVLTNTNVMLKDVVHNGKNYSPNLQSLSIGIVGDEVRLDSQTQTEISSGIWSICQTTSFYTIVLATKSDGTQTLNYKQAQNPVANNSTKTSVGVEIEQELLPIIAMIAIMVISVLTDGAGTGVAVLILSLLSGAAAFTPDAIEAVGQGDAPPLDMLVFNSTDPISWSDSKDFNLNFASLNGALQLGEHPISTRQRVMNAREKYLERCIASKRMF